MLRTLVLAAVALCAVGVTPASAHGPRFDSRHRHEHAWHHRGPYYGPYYGWRAYEPWPRAYYADEIVVPAPAPVIVAPPPPPFVLRPGYVGPHWRHRW
jgi:hypothetical protein